MPPAATALARYRTTGGASQPVNRRACGRCGSSRTTTIGMHLTDGSGVLFTACRACEHKTWTGQDGELALGGVLERATKVRA